MRGVAAELGVEAMSLYHHVPGGKDALLDGVVGAIVSGAGDVDAAPVTWRAGLAAFAIRYREVLAAHPNAVPLVAARPAAGYRAAGDQAGLALAMLRQAGFADADAARAIRVVVRWIIGFALGEAASPTGPPLADAAAAGSAAGAILAGLGTGEDSLFAFGLEALIDGLEARVSPRTG